MSTRPSSSSAAGGAKPPRPSVKRSDSPKGARNSSAPKARPSSGAASSASRLSSGAASSSAAPKGKSGGAQGAIGAYTKLKAVGKGSFGQIWLVRHTQKGGDQVVLKEVHLKKLSPNEVKAAKLEIEVLKKMSHPNIIGFVNTFEVEGITGLLMEHAAAGDLGTAIAKRIKGGRVRFPESEIKTLCVQLASALNYMHDTLQLVHRDVKPANIFMSELGDVKLGDFGLCAYLKGGSLGGEPVSIAAARNPLLLPPIATATPTRTRVAAARRTRRTRRRAPLPALFLPPLSTHLAWRHVAGGYADLYGPRVTRRQVLRPWHRCVGLRVHALRGDEPRRPMGPAGGRLRRPRRWDGRAAQVCADPAAGYGVT